MKNPNEYIIQYSRVEKSSVRMVEIGDRLYKIYINPLKFNFDTLCEEMHILRNINIEKIKRYFNENELNQLKEMQLYLQEHGHMDGNYAISLEKLKSKLKN